MSVTRSDSPWERELYPLPLTKSLPNIAMPLRETDDDIVLPLQDLIDQCYERGRYSRRIDYTKPPIPRFEEENVSRWADQLIDEWGS